MKHRIFIAINLPQDIKRGLARLILDLQKANPDPTIKWVRPEGLHITLHFLGYLDEEQIEKIKQVINLQLTTCSLQTRELFLTEIDGFPNMNRPRVIFVATKEVNGGNLIRLQKNLGQDLEKAGFEIDSRPWQPHITLARIKTPGIKIQTTSHKLQVTNFEIESLDLMESELRRDGARYKILKKFLISN